MQLTEAGCAAMFVPTDVTVESEVARLIDSAVERFGRLDCIVNNAGWHPPGETIDQVTVGDFERLLRLNLTSTFIGCKLAVPHLRKTRGSIINMSSEAGVIGQTEAPRYVTTKAGQIGLTRALALDLAADGIRVNAVLPRRRPYADVGRLGRQPRRPRPGHGDGQTGTPLGSVGDDRRDR